MTMHNIIECSSKYSKTTESLLFYSKDEATGFNADINDNHFKSFMYKAKLLGNTAAPTAPSNANGILKDAKIAVPLKYSSIFRN